MKILVTGGAGYIGSAAVKKLIEEGHDIVVIDNLSKGQKRLIDVQAEFQEGDLMDINFLESVFSRYQFDSVIHFAGYKSVGESMTELSKYSQNIICTINLLDCMVKFGVQKIIFSSSSAVYGDPEYIPIDENHPLNSTNYYGFTKLKCEEIILWYSQLKGIVGICLRYFNVFGDAGCGYNQEGAEDIYSIIKGVIEEKRKKLVVFGNDYETRDGTCVRDYININDLVRAHILALKVNKSDIINLGTGKGITILELIKKVEKETGRKISWEYGSRREGDIVNSVASYEKAKKILGWIPGVSVK